MQQFAQTDALGVANFEGYSNQKLSIDIPKNVGYNLAPGEITAVKDRLNALALRMPAYHVAALGPDDAEAISAAASDIVDCVRRQLDLVHEGRLARVPERDVKEARISWL